MNQDIRWKQRFQNFEKAYLFLRGATEREFLDELQQAGLIQDFEFTFELVLNANASAIRKVERSNLRTLS